jgi:hypothetical protein
MDRIDLGRKPTLNLQIFAGINNPHQAVLTAYMHGKHSVHATQTPYAGNRFASALAMAMGDRGRFYISHVRQLQPFYVLAFLNAADHVMHTVMIDEVDIGSRNISVAEVREPSGVQFSDLVDVVNARKSLTPYLFTSKEVDRILRRLNLLHK